MSFTIAIIGRPNVGKSTLFNRLVGQKLALVDDEPGVTRDRREGEARLGDLEFTVIDTAGLDEGAKGSLTARMQEQTEAAIALADALMFVIDARAGLTPNDRSFADFARRALAPVARDAGLVVDQRELLPDQTIEQRRFADIGPADNGNREGHKRSMRALRAYSAKVCSGFAIRIRADY